MQQARIDALANGLERHEFHVEKLEQILRLLDNESLEPEQAADIRESVEYYVDSNMEDDFVEDDGLYDSLNIDESYAKVFAPQPVKDDSDESDDSYTAPSRGNVACGQLLFVADVER